jgi:hypothetical protein
MLIDPDPSFDPKSFLAKVGEGRSITWCPQETHATCLEVMTSRRLIIGNS